MTTRSLQTPDGSKQTARDRVRVISITSGKGGVGKTNITANLGIALARKEQRVLVWDADLGLANLDLVLGLNAEFNIWHLFEGLKTLDEIIIDGPAGIKIRPASSGIQEMANIDQGQKLRLLNDLDDYSQELNYLLIDTGAGINTNVMYFNMAAQEKIIVVTPEPTSITDAYALIKVMTQKYQEKNYKILVNQVTDSAEAKNVFSLLANVADIHLNSISLDYLGFIPEDEYIPRAVKKQQAVMEAFPSADSSQHFVKLARQVMSAPTDVQLDGSIKFFWKRLLKI